MNIRTKLPKTPGMQRAPSSPSLTEAPAGFPPKGTNKGVTASLQEG